MNRFSSAVAVSALLFSATAAQAKVCTTDEFCFNFALSKHYANYGHSTQFTTTNGSESFSITVEAFSLNLDTDPPSDYKDADIIQTLGGLGIDSKGGHRSKIKDDWWAIDELKRCYTEALAITAECTITIQSLLFGNVDYGDDAVVMLIDNEHGTVTAEEYVELGGLHSGFFTGTDDFTMTLDPGDMLLIGAPTDDYRSKYGKPKHGHHGGENDFTLAGLCLTAECEDGGDGDTPTVPTPASFGAGLIAVASRRRA